MAEKERHFDESLELKVSEGLSADLKALFGPDMPVPPEVDRAVMDKAHQHLLRRRPRRVLGWAASAAAVAAVIMLVLILNIREEPALDSVKAPASKVARELTRTLSGPVAAAARADIDRNGRVDILDAFKLARHLESIGRAEMKWDINGDGLVNRSDVDSVAFAAVRLDKGVL